MYRESIKDKILCKLLDEDIGLANELNQELKKTGKKTDKKRKATKTKILLKSVLNL